MGKAIKTNHHEKEQQKKNLIASLVILAIMVLSIAGFALMSGGNISSSSSSSNLPLGQNFQDADGNLYYGAVKNGEQFIFLNGIDGYDENTQMSQLSQKILSHPIIDVYIDPAFTSDDSIYIIEKALSANLIYSQRIQNTSCEAETLIFTYNNTYSGDCMVFVAIPGEEYTQAEALLYHLIK